MVKPKEDADTAALAETHVEEGGGGGGGGLAFYTQRWGFGGGQQQSRLEAAGGPFVNSFSDTPGAFESLLLAGGAGSAASADTQSVFAHAARKQPTAMIVVAAVGLTRDSLLEAGKAVIAAAQSDVTTTTTATTAPPTWVDIPLTAVRWHGRETVTPASGLLEVRPGFAEPVIYDREALVALVRSLTGELPLTAAGAISTLVSIDASLGLGRYGGRLRLRPLPLAAVAQPASRNTMPPPIPLTQTIGRPPRQPSSTAFATATATANANAIANANTASDNTSLKGPVAFAAEMHRVTARGYEIEFAVVNPDEDVFVAVVNGTRSSSQKSASLVSAESDAAHALAEHRADADAVARFLHARTRALAPALPSALAAAAPRAYRATIFCEIVAVGGFEDSQSVFVAYELAVPRGSGWRLVAVDGEEGGKTLRGGAHVRDAGAKSERAVAELTRTSVAVGYDAEHAISIASHALAAADDGGSGAWNPDVADEDEAAWDEMFFQNEETLSGLEVGGAPAHAPSAPSGSALRARSAALVAGRAETDALLFEKGETALWLAGAPVVGVTQVARFAPRPWLFGSPAASRASGSRGAHAAARAAADAQAAEPNGFFGRGCASALIDGIHPFGFAPKPLHPSGPSPVPGFAKGGTSLRSGRRCEGASSISLVSSGADEEFGGSREAAAISLNPSPCAQVANISYPFSFSLVWAPGACVNPCGPSPPVIFLHVHSVDSGGIVRAVGYGSVAVPCDEPGMVDVRASCWQPVNSEDSAAAEADFFLGGATRLADASAARVPSFWTDGARWRGGEGDAVGADSDDLASPSPVAAIHQARAALSRAGGVSRTAGDVGLRFSVIRSTVPRAERLSAIHTGRTVLPSSSKVFLATARRGSEMQRAPAAMASTQRSDPLWHGASHAKKTVEQIIAEAKALRKVDRDLSSLRSAAAV